MIELIGCIEIRDECISLFAVMYANRIDSGSTQYIQSKRVGTLSTSAGEGTVESGRLLGLTQIVRAVSPVDQSKLPPAEPKWPSIEWNRQYTMEVSADPQTRGIHAYLIDGDISAEAAALEGLEDETVGVAA